MKRRELFAAIWMAVAGLFTAACPGGSSRRRGSAPARRGGY